MNDSKLSSSSSDASSRRRMKKRDQSPERETRKERERERETHMTRRVKGRRAPFFESWGWYRPVSLTERREGNEGRVRMEREKSERRVGILFDEREEKGKMKMDCRRG